MRIKFSKELYFMELTITVLVPKLY